MRIFGGSSLQFAIEIPSGVMMSHDHPEIKHGIFDRLTLLQGVYYIASMRTCMQDRLMAANQYSPV